MDVGTGVTVTGTSVGVGVAAGVGVTSTTGFEEPHPVKVSIIVMPSTSIICFAFIIYHPLRSEDRSISIFIFYSSFYYPMYALKSQISVHKSIFREVFCHIYDKIPRHTGQNAITVGDLKCILAKCCERSEQQLNQAAITIFYSSLVRI